MKFVQIGVPALAIFCFFLTIDLLFQQHFVNSAILMLGSGFVGTVGALWMNRHA
jgi:hypothetical protein